MNHDGSEHAHSFGQERPRAGERRTWIVISLTAITMVVEVAAGVAFGSMALLADGLHMASHAVALAITAFAYLYARRHAFDPRFGFGTGKVNALGGFTGAVLLALFAIVMATESVTRFFSPREIAFDQAMLVAGIGLAVNVASALVLRVEHDDHAPGEPHHHAHEDHNLRSAYLHVLADALTSVAAILALLAAKYLGAGWMDPTMGLVGSLLVARWSIGLIRVSSRVLLDHQAPEPLRERILAAVEGRPGERVTDLHVWSVGPGIWAAELTLVSEAPASPDTYKRRLPADLGLVHATIEVHSTPTTRAEPE